MYETIFIIEMFGLVIEYVICIIFVPKFRFPVKVFFLFTF